VAHWRAARYGISRELIDVVDQRELPAAALIEKMLNTLRPALEAEGNWEEIASLVRETLQQGNGATRQRAAYQRNGRMEDVVDFMVAETRRGIGKGT
jgi:carboxylate-amine ligase